MDIQKLKYFYAVAKIGHVTKAAEELHISQPSLTQAIHQLESELDVPLFRKQGRRIVLTEFGTHLKQRLDILLPEFDDLPNELMQYKSTVHKTIRLNILAASSFVINAIIKYKKSNPDIVFDFEQNELRRDCDIVIATNGVRLAFNKACSKRCVKEERIFLAVPKQSEYAERKSVKLSDVKDEKFIMLSSYRLFGAICKRLCTIAGFTPNILFESDSPAAVQNVIGMGAGISFWPEYTWGKLNDKNVVLLPVSSPSCKRDLIVELYDRTPKSDYAEDFFNFLLKQIP